MKKIISLFLAVVLMLGCATILSSCASEDDGAQIKVYLGNMTYDLDPSDYYVSDNAAQFMSLVFEPLFRINAKGKLECAAAKSYKVNKDERTIVITLRESYWSDGVRVKATDFIYSWRNRLLDPNVQNPAAALFFDIENAAEVKAGTKRLYDLAVVDTDLYEITINYREGADVDQLLRNLASLAASPVREDNVSKAPDYWTKDFSYLVTNGAFSVYQNDDNAFILARNTGYHQDPNSKNVKKQVTPDKIATFYANNSFEDLNEKDLTAKTVFYIGDEPLEARSSAAKSRVVKDTLSTYGFLFNCEKAPFDNKNVRYALSLALDRAAIAQTVVFGKAADGYLPDTVAGSAGALLGAQDVDTAKGLINAAGLTSTQKNIKLTVENTEEAKAIAELAKEAWGELGFTVTVNALGAVTSKVNDFATSSEMTIKDNGVQAQLKKAIAGECDFDVIGADFQMYSDDAFVGLCAFSAAMNGGVVGGYASTEYDALVADIYNAKDANERKAKISAAETLLVEDAPIVPVLFGQNFYACGAELSGLTVDYFGNVSFTKAVLKNYTKYFFDKKED